MEKSGALVLVVVVVVVDGSWLGHGNGSGGSVEDPHAVLSGVPELLRLADGGPHAELQEVRATWAHNPTPQLYGGGEEELQRDGFGSHS